MSAAQRLEQGLQQLALALSSDTQARLLQYVALLHKWNSVYNLTAVRDPEQMVTRHILDSLTVVPFLHGEHVLDVGTGAGLPGIPLALACPERRFVLLDANAKKSRFVTQAVAELGLTAVEVVRSRVEDYRPAQRRFDSILSRAFASITDMLKLSGHLCAEHGRFLAMKGAYPMAELETIEPGFQVEQVAHMEVPGLQAERHLLVISRGENPTRT